jgi:hypothetical protein
MFFYSKWGTHSLAAPSTDAQFGFIAKFFEFRDFFGGNSEFASHVSVFIFVYVLPTAQ